jgi:hypothetical protein
VVGSHIRSGMVDVYSERKLLTETEDKRASSNRDKQEQAKEKVSRLVPSSDCALFDVHITLHIIIVFVFNLPTSLLL